MKWFDFDRYPQQPFYFEDNRSDEEKLANAKLLHEKRVWVIVQCVGIGFFIGLSLGLWIGFVF